MLLLFGSKLPDAAESGIGRSLRIFKAETKGLMEDDNRQSKVRPHRRQRQPGRRRAGGCHAGCRFGADGSTPTPAQPSASSGGPPAAPMSSVPVPAGAILVTGPGSARWRRSQPAARHFLINRGMTTYGGASTTARISLRPQGR